MAGTRKHRVLSVLVLSNYVYRGKRRASVLPLSIVKLPVVQNFTQA